MGAALCPHAWPLQLTDRILRVTSTGLYEQTLSCQGREQSNMLVSLDQLLFAVVGHLSLISPAQDSPQAV
jgi:hypothetical protein